MKELKACPFCKEKNFKLYSIGQLETKMLQCQTVKCPLWGIAFRVEAWNTRTSPALLAECEVTEVEVHNFSTLFSIVMETKNGKESVSPQGLIHRIGDLFDKELGGIEGMKFSITKREE